MALPESMLSQYKEYLDEDRCGIYEFRGRKLIVLPTVFDPTHNTPRLAEIVEDRVRQVLESGERCRVFEMGTGSGAAILSAAQVPGAVASACDISPMSVANAQVNALWWGIDCEVYQSDLFESVPVGRFDVIFWSMPWISGDPGELSDVRYRAAFDPGYASVTRFLEACHSRLSSIGRVILSVDRDVCDYPLILSMIEAAGFRWSIADEAPASFEGMDLTYVYLELEQVPATVVGEPVPTAATGEPVTV